MALQKFIRWLLPREDHFFDLVEKQADVVLRGAQALAQFQEVNASSAETRASIQDLEHEGDALVHEVEEALARTFVTPIDREDLHKLATELDDILDLINLTARSCSLYGVDRPTPPMIQLFEILVEATVLIREAMPKLRKHEYEAFLETKRKISKLEKDGDTIFRESVSDLFHNDTIDAKVLLREKEVLEAVECAIDRCEDVAEFLTNLAIKHG